MMNGDIKVRSAPGKGSRFTVTIILNTQDTGSEFVEELAHLPVLVADDDQSCCEGTVVLLREIGMDGEWVLSSEEAVERTVSRHEKGEDFFAVIIDWKMPVMNGYEAAMAIRALPGGGDIPVIAMTANAFAEDVLLARNAGMNEHIAKPLDLTKLGEVMQKWLR